ncbi:hypothetical protein [uncultured Nostoc sp.]|uniref:hypothetical protein n=1 Tax=uncultured Nostoc sp. TaxID=340711 RepID=UPI0035CB68C9
MKNPPIWVLDEAPLAVDKGLTTNKLPNLVGYFFICQSLMKQKRQSGDRSKGL